MLSMLIKELMYYINNAKELIVISFLFISITLVIPFAFSAKEGVPDGVNLAILWVALLASMQLGAAQSWQRHSDSGELELLPLLPWMLEGTVLGKSIAFYLLMLLQVAIVVPLSAVWLAIPVGQWAQVWLGLAVGGLSLTFLYQMAAGLMAGQRKAGAVIGIIVLPFAIPVVIFGASYFQQDELFNDHLLFLVGYAVFLAPLHALAVASSIRHGH